MKNLMNLGKVLNKNEQKEINGGEMPSMCIDECGPSAGGFPSWGCGGDPSKCLTRYCDGRADWRYCSA